MRKNHITTCLLITLAAATPAFGQSGPTQVTEVVMYAINNDKPCKLVRYNFETQEYVVIGSIVGNNGEVLDDIECLGYIAQGPNKGFYAANNFNGKDKSRLIKINPFTGAATAFPVYIGYGYVVGLVAWEKTPGQWVLYASHSGKVNQQGSVVKELLEINPATGVGSLIMPLTNIYEDLARDANGTIYGVAPKPDKGLWIIQPPKPGVAGKETRVGTTGYDKIEGLGIAFGDTQPQIAIPGVQSSWTVNGTMFAFDDPTNKFLVINPGSAASVVYVTPFSQGLATSDAEGLVFFTKKTDPYGHVVADPCD